MVENGERNGNYIRTSRLMLDNDNWGLIKTFGHMDIRELRTRHWIEFLNNLSKRRSDLSTSTRNMLSATFRNVMKEARQDGVIDDVPDTLMLILMITSFYLNTKTEQQQGKSFNGNSEHC